MSPEEQERFWERHRESRLDMFMSFENAPESEQRKMLLGMLYNHRAVREGLLIPSTGTLGTVGIVVS